MQCTQGAGGAVICDRDHKLKIYQRKECPELHDRQKNSH